MTVREAAVISIYTGYALLEGDDLKYLYKYAEELVGRPVNTYELTSKTLRGMAFADFYEICKNVTREEDHERKDMSLLRDGEKKPDIRRKDPTERMDLKAAPVS